MPVSKISIPTVLTFLINIMLSIVYFSVIAFGLGFCLVLLLRLQGQAAYQALETLESVELICLITSLTTVLVLWWKFKNFFFIQKLPEALAKKVPKKT